MIEILLAFIAGILTIAAPCILLPLPILLGSSVGQTSKTRPLFLTLGFVLTFAVLGLSLNFLVQSLGVDPNTLRHIAVGLLALFAVFLIYPAPFERLMSHASNLITKATSTGQSAGNGKFGGFVMGMIVGIIWAPCAGPILGSILTLVANQADLGRATLLLTAYSLGAGLPMLAIAYGGQAVTTKVRGIAKYSKQLQQIFGVILILVAGAVYFQYDTKLQAYLVDKFPIFQGNFESNLLCKLPFYTPRGDECEHRETEESSISNFPAYAKDSADRQFPISNTAADFVGIENWINSPPLSIQDLKGKVVLLDFWTYSCINCVRTLPYLTKWDETYRKDGLIIIGIHTPEFAFEKNTDNLKKAIKQHDIRYAVAQDNDYQTWKNYNNRYWPAKYLIDKNGVVVYTHFGEGAYEETERKIQELLAMDAPLQSKQVGQFNSIDSVNTDKLCAGGQCIRTPEIYLGLTRLKNFSGQASKEAGEYVIPNHLRQNTFALEGKWKFENDKITLTESQGKIKLRFFAGKVFLVAESPNKTAGQTITVKADGYPATSIVINQSTLYEIFSSKDYKEHILEITIPEAGFSAYTFTFG